jgi:hypothetical protein
MDDYISLYIYFVYIYYLINSKVQRCLEVGFERGLEVGFEIDIN